MSELLPRLNVEFSGGARTVIVAEYDELKELIGTPAIGEYEMHPGWWSGDDLRVTINWKFVTHIASMSPMAARPRAVAA